MSPPQDAELAGLERVLVHSSQAFDAITFEIWAPLLSGGCAVVAPAGDIDAIVLRELDGLSYEEIAAAMECPVGTVRSRIFRAREAIDKRLREVFEGGLGRTEEMI